MLQYRQCLRSHVLLDGASKTWAKQLFESSNISIISKLHIGFGCDVRLQVVSCQIKCVSMLFSDIIFAQVCCVCVCVCFSITPLTFNLLKTRTPTKATSPRH